MFWKILPLPETVRIGSCIGNIQRNMLNAFYSTFNNVVQALVEVCVKFETELRANTYYNVGK